MKRLISSLILSGWLLAACGGAASPTPGAGDVPVVRDDFAVIAEGRLLPGKYAQLSFATSGRVDELLVAENDQVAQGDVLARLDSGQARQAEVARAEQEVLSAQQALDDLQETAAMTRAQAQKEVAQAQEALDQAERRLRGVENPDLKYYRDRVTDAQNNLLNAQQQTEITDIGSLRAGLQSARDFLKLMDEKLGKIKAAIDGCPADQCDPKRRVQVDRYPPQTLDDAQDDYNDALNRVRELELQLDQAERGNQTALRDAQKAFDDAKQNLADAEKASAGSPNAIRLAQAEADVSLAQARLAQAQADYAKVQSGPDPDKLAAAQARLATARAALAAAQAALADIELRAPFAGTVADVKLKVGEQVAPGQAIVTLADFSTWVVDTDNLTEIEVVKVRPGQKATIVLDALPEVTLHGVVTAVSPVFEDKRGDVTYTVSLNLADGDPMMRWGMTAVVTFEK